MSVEREWRIVILGFLNGMKPFVSGEFQFGGDGEPGLISPVQMRWKVCLAGLFASNERNFKKLSLLFDTEK